MSGEPLRPDIVARLEQVRALKPRPVPPPRGPVSVIVNALRPLPARNYVPPAVQIIKDIVCAQAGLSALELVAQRRNRKVSRPRHIAMDMCRRYTNLSYPRIGHLFGGLDHASVMHGVKRCKLLSDPLNDKFDAEFAALYLMVEAECRAEFDDTTSADKTINDTPDTNRASVLATQSRCESTAR